MKASIIYTSFLFYCKIKVKNLLMNHTKKGTVFKALNMISYNCDKKITKKTYI